MAAAVDKEIEMQLPVHGVPLGCSTLISLRAVLFLFDRCGDWIVRAISRSRPR
jgi:hypothetical protein